MSYLLIIIHAMARALLHTFYVMTAKIVPPEFSCVMADPIHYTEQKVEFLSVARLLSVAS